MTEWQKKATTLPKNYMGRRQNENTNFSTKDMFRLNTTVTTFLTIVYQKRIFTIWSKYVDSNMSLKYVFHEKMSLGLKKHVFCLKKWFLP